ncbi:MAG: hypothetical protein ACM3IJ_03030 [Candidatus Levyibacteriota bacterium]
MRRWINREDGFMEGQVVESWSGKRILVACLVLLILGGFGFYLLQKTGKKASEVLGATFNPVPTTEVKVLTKDDAGKLLNQAKKELESLTAENLTASGAALQKIILDLQSIQKGNSNPVEAFCNLVCKK